MNVKIAIERSLDVAVAYPKAQGLLDDIGATLGRFPKLRKLNKVGDNAYVWEMSAIGSKIANISHEVTYGAQYALDRTNGKLSWKALPKKGNATVEGYLLIRPKGKGAQLSFEVHGELRDVPVPLMYRLLAPPFIQGKFAYLVDAFLQRTHDHLLSVE
jgi:hypothetical protein